MKGRISVPGTDNKKLTFQNNVPFIKCLWKINNIFIDNAEDLDVAMSMCNLLGYSDNYSMTSRPLWNYYRDEVNDAANNKINSNKTASKSFEYKTKLMANTQIIIVD